MKYEVIDNFLPEEEHKKIKDLMMSTQFPWFYQNGVAHDCDGNLKGFYFTHIFYNDGKYSQFIPDLSFLVNKITEIKNVLDIKRIKGNLYPRSDEYETDPYHTDYDFDHLGAIYSINSNNGGTFFCIDDEEICIDSVENRIVFFEGNKMHKSKRCTNEKVRVNINFNLITKTIDE